MSAQKERLLDLYEATADEDAYLAARALYEQALKEAPDAALLVGYGYLLDSHAQHTLRQAVAQYERAIELDPGADKPHYHLIRAYARLGETDRAVAVYERRLAASPMAVRELRFLATAYLGAREYSPARAMVDRGLGLAPNDPRLIELRGDVCAGTGDPDGALADWRRALELAPDELSPAYSSAFLLEREGRTEEAAETWRFIVDWCESRGAALTAEWPKRELERLRGSS